ncbi:MAG: glucose-6-phosphate isomerase [Verrucomicrobia bacterium]|nr:glucose-6-phosphate isomerase [Verrucomicrobiota bacterium]
MKFSREDLLVRFQNHYHEYPSLGLGIDLSRMNFPDDFLAAMEPRIQKSFEAMSELERGSKANPDEGRMVGHYWLRNPAIAPIPEISQSITETLRDIRSFTAKVHDGSIRGANGPFENLLVIGIGGSALGPQFVSRALGEPTKDRLSVHFFDNTDPDGMDYVLARIGDGLGRTLCVVISKSGGTQETRNGMLEAKAAFEKRGLKFESHAVAVTGENSKLDQTASSGGWLKRFPMWDWVGGRTSELSAVGLLPAALQGLDIDGMLAGAKACDEITRSKETRMNPSGLLALMWYYIGEGRGSKDMVILPYKDRLELFSKYLQQLIMESLGKELDLDGNVVNQGIAVYGNKGSTDQHAYVQQLREGLNNFFVTFVEVLRDRADESLHVEPDVTSGDYLNGFFQGSRRALYENGRESITLTVTEVSPFSIGVLIALYERAVGFYASLTNLNAYHQPGVEAGKKAAASVISLQTKVQEFLSRRSGNASTASEISEGIGSKDEAETIFKICEHLAANPDRGIRKIPGKVPFNASYQWL